jgi:hypothetical protein
MAGIQDTRPTGNVRSYGEFWCTVWPRLRDPTGRTGQIGVYRKPLIALACTPLLAFAVDRVPGINRPAIDANAVAVTACGRAEPCSPDIAKRGYGPPNRNAANSQATIRTKSFRLARLRNELRVSMDPPRCARQSGVFGLRIWCTRGIRQAPRRSRDRCELQLLR